jgi:hypothetical protein
LSFDPGSLIRDVSNSLRAKLLARLGEIDSELTENDIRLESPSEIEGNPERGLALFLYKISENAFLKNQDYTETYYRDPVELRNPDLALDLFYLVIPFGLAERRQVTLARVLQLLYFEPILRNIPDKEPILTEELVNSGNHEIRIILADMTMEQQNNLWSMFPNSAYRLSLSYLVTPLYIRDSGIREYERVISKDSYYQPVSRVKG